MCGICDGIASEEQVISPIHTILRGNLLDRPSLIDNFDSVYAKLVQSSETRPQTRV